MRRYCDDHAIAEQLAEATRNGKLAEAYRILQEQDCDSLRVIALRAGFACIRTENPRELMAHLASQVAAAARNRTDGHGLRARKSGASPQHDEGAV